MPASAVYSRARLEYRPGPGAVGRDEIGSRFQSGCRVNLMRMDPRTASDVLGSERW